MTKILNLSTSLEYGPIVEKVAAIVHKISGNKYGEKQSFMIESRIKKRMMELAINTPEEYLKYIEETKTEINNLVSLMTTHHTFFFREFAHFELLKLMLPQIVAACKKRGDRTIHIWSAACSRGHEVYSLAMFMEFFLPTIDQKMTYKILGTDIDSESISVANNGVYHHNELKEIPMNFLGDHWAKGTGDILLYSKIKKNIRSKCEFNVGNLLNVKKNNLNQKFDIVFCRNVFIYFEPFQIETITKDLLCTMHPGGLFFSGMSESLMGYQLNVTSVGPSVYINTAPKITTQTTVLKSEDVQTITTQCLKVLCVDDSPTIHNMLKKILSKEAGFEIIATAANGIEAAEKLLHHKVDVVTLDIHMPEMDGITYLKKYFNPEHPPVMMVSSASREDADVAIQSLKLGASDYVEKPTLMNLEERGDEIRNKLRMIGMVPFKSKKISSMDKDFQTKIVVENADKKLRIIIATVADIPKIISLFTEATHTQPPTVILFEGYGDILEMFVNEHRFSFKQKVYNLNENVKKLDIDSIYFGDARKMMKSLQLEHSSKQTSILCYGIMSRWISQEIIVWKTSHIILEDFGYGENIRHPLYARASDIVAPTSFYYLSNCFLGKNK